MKPSEILEAAKYYLWDGDGFHTQRQRFICLAVEEVQCPSSESITMFYMSGVLIQDHMVKLLDGERTLSDWLKVHHNIDYNGDTRRLQATRLAWMDDMIKYFQLKGL